MKFQGSMVAIVTPFKNGKVDLEAYKNLIKWQANSGVSAIVPCGTTGEAATLSDQDRDLVIKTAIELCNGKVAVVVGTGSNNTETAIKYARHAKDAGADGHLSVTPYYNSPTQEGLYQHYKAISEACDLPMILYNVPGRTGVNMTSETTLRLSKFDNIVGTKEACGDIQQIRNIIAKRPEDFCVLCGNDDQNFEVYEAGGNGCISVAANLVPEQVSQVWNLFTSGKAPQAKEIHENLALLHRALFIESNPIPVKTALAAIGKCDEEFKLPLTFMSKNLKKELLQVLERYGLQVNN